MRETEALRFIRLMSCAMLKRTGVVMAAMTVRPRSTRREMTIWATSWPLQTGSSKSAWTLIVNLASVVELRTQGQGDYMAVLQGGRKASVTLGLRELEQRLRYG